MNITFEEFCGRLKVHAAALRRHKVLEPPVGHYIHPRTRDRARRRETVEKSMEILFDEL